MANCNLEDWSGDGERSAGVDTRDNCSGKMLQN